MINISPRCEWCYKDATRVFTSDRSSVTFYGQENFYRWYMTYVCDDHDRDTRDMRIKELNIALWVRQ